MIERFRRVDTLVRVSPEPTIRMPVLNLFHIHSMLSRMRKTGGRKMMRTSVN
jgi:hypothetical protein